MIGDNTARRTDPPGEPERRLDPPVEVVVTVRGETFPGIAERWRGRWVYCSWSAGVGLKHLGWVLGENVRRTSGRPESRTP